MKFKKLFGRKKVTAARREPMNLFLNVVSCAFPVNDDLNGFLHSLYQPELLTIAWSICILVAHERPSILGADIPLFSSPPMEGGEELVDLVHLVCFVYLLNCIQPNRSDPQETEAGSPVSLAVGHAARRDLRSS